MVNLEAETRDGVSGAKKRFFGVTKLNNRWMARVRNPMLRVDVHLGYYKSPEEAALVVQKKKAEIDEMLKGEDRSSMGTCRGYFKGKKLPTGVSWNNGSYRVQIWNPKLKKTVSGGSYITCEEAADAADRKREELQEMYEGIFKKPERLVTSKSGCLGEQTGDVKVNSGKCAVRIEKPDSKARISLGTYNTLDAKLKRPDFDLVEFRPETEVNETPVKFEREFGYDCRPTSVLDAHNLENLALCDNSSYDCGIVDIPAKLGDGLVAMSPPSDFDPENLNNARAPGSDKSCDSEFDRAVSLGIINEYGQLLGEYSKLDKQMGIKTA